MEKVKREVSPIVCCAQSEWIIPEFISLVRMKQKNISHCFRSLRAPDVVWQLSIDILTDLRGDEIPGICFNLFLTSGLRRLSRKGAKGWANVNIVLKINSRQTSLIDEVLGLDDLAMDHRENEHVEFRNFGVKAEDIYNVLVNDTLTLTCSVNYCVLDESDECQLMAFYLSEVLVDCLSSECVVIKVEDRVFNIHKKILNFHSPVFQRMFQHQIAESLTGVVSITDHSAEAIGDLLAYMYLGRVENGDNVEELFEVADKYNVSNLKRICEQMLIQKLSIDNVCRIFVLADLHSGNDLKMACLEFYVLNRKKIFETNEWKTLKSTYPDLTNSLIIWIFNSY